MLVQVSSRPLYPRVLRHDALISTNFNLFNSPDYRNESARTPNMALISKLHYQETIMQSLFSTVLMLIVPLCTSGCTDEMPIRAEFDLGPVDLVKKPIEKNRIKATSIQSDQHEKRTSQIEDAHSAPVMQEKKDIRIELNGAPLEELVTLPGVGPAMAKKIYSYRKSRPFTRVRDLRRIRGIGPATFERLKPLVRVDKLVKPGESKEAD